MVAFVCREEEALRAHRAMKQELLDAAAEWAERHGQAAAGADSDSDDEGGRAAAPPGLASALAAALRLLAAQVKLIRVDAANSRLQVGSRRANLVASQLGCV